MGTKSRTEVKMAIRLHKPQGMGRLNVVKVEGGKGKEREIIVRQSSCSKWKRWNHDNLLHDWNKNYFVK
jgi:hypothetical protein